MSPFSPGENKRNMVSQDGDDLNKRMTIRAQRKGFVCAESLQGNYGKEAGKKGRSLQVCMKHRVKTSQVKKV